MICGRKKKLNVIVFFKLNSPKTSFCHNLTTFSKNLLKTERVYVRVMIILQTKFYPIPVVIENITASAHMTYYANITPSYPICRSYTVKRAEMFEFCETQ